MTGARSDRELALARAGCALLDAERAANPANPANPSNPESQVPNHDAALRRWCAARVHDPRVPALGHLPVSGNAGLLAARADERPTGPRLLGPDARLRRRDGFKLTDPRMDPREVLSEIHYCVLCHERDKDSCSKGLRDEKGRHRRQPARHRARRLSARREDLRDARAAQGGRCDRRARARDARQPDVPGHRPPHLQRLHEVVHLPEAGAGQHPADRDRRADRRPRDAVGRRDLRAADALESAERPPPLRAAVQRQERPGRRPRPGRLHARALPGERRLRRRRHRRPEDRAAAGRMDRTEAETRRGRFATGARSTGSSTSASSKASAACRSTASRFAGTRTS